MRSIRAAIGAALAALLVVLAPGAGALAEEPPLRGAFGEAFVLVDDPEPAPRVSFQARDGETVQLGDFEGRVVLLNFWATWCAPCVEEMPTLDRLEAELKDEGLSVLAVSQDRGGREVVEPFLRDELSLDELGIYLDPKGELARAFGIRGMPTTYLIDARGRVVGGMEGPAEWDGPAAKALVRHYLEAGRAAGVIQSGG